MDIVIRTQLWRDLDTLASALADIENATWYDVYLVLNCASALTGIRQAARLETTSKPFWKALRKLLRLQRYSHLRIVKWRRGNAVEPILANVSDPQVRADLDDIRHAYDIGVQSDIDPRVVTTMGRLLGYLCPYRQDDDMYNSGGELAITAMWNGSPVSIFEFGCHQKDTKPRRLASMLKDMNAKWVAPANDLIAGCTLYGETVGPFEAKFTEPDQNHLRRVRLQFDINTIADALSQDTDVHQRINIVVNCALALAGVRSAVRLDTQSRAFWSALKKLLRKPRYANLGIAHGEYVVANVSQPNVKAELATTSRAHSSGTVRLFIVMYPIENETQYENIMVAEFECHPKSVPSMIEKVRKECAEPATAALAEMIIYDMVVSHFDVEYTKR